MDPIQGGRPGSKQEPAIRVTGDDAKPGVGSHCTQATREPVRQGKNGQLDSVIFSAEHCHALKAHRGTFQRGEGKKAFEAEFADGSLAQNALVATHGVPGADLRPW